MPPPPPRSENTLVLIRGSCCYIDSLANNFSVCSAFRPLLRGFKRYASKHLLQRGIALGLVNRNCVPYQHFLSVKILHFKK